SHVGMTMEEGPWFFRSFSGGWNFVARDDGRTEATWRYNFTVRPSWLRFVADPLGRWFLGRDLRRRLDAFARAAADPSILAALGTGATDPPADPAAGDAPGPTP